MKLLQFLDQYWSWMTIQSTCIEAVFLSKGIPYMPYICLFWSQSWQMPILELLVILTTMKILMHWWQFNNNYVPFGSRKYMRLFYIPVFVNVEIIIQHWQWCNGTSFLKKINFANMFGDESNHAMLIDLPLAKWNWILQSSLIIIIKQGLD